MCGEHAWNSLTVVRVGGSSPHVRGTPTSSKASVWARGIIPACAGNTDLTEFLAFADGDHPRMCGEHFTTPRRRRCVPGSSPHVRGTLAVGHATGREHGIIPACAGNTRLTFSKPCAIRDHPRMCGEHLEQVARRLGQEGSSPHVRGTLTVAQHISYRRGIIPACAGNTVFAASVCVFFGDHPRMCGEHIS